MLTILTADDVAEQLAVSRDKVYRLISSGSLHAINVGVNPDRACYRILPSDFELFLTSRSTSPLTNPMPEL